MPVVDSGGGLPSWFIQPKSRTLSVAPEVSSPMKRFWYWVSTVSRDDVRVPVEDVFE